VHVASRVVGFKKIRFYTNENVGSGDLDLPEQQMHTTACWLTIPGEVLASLPFTSEDRRDGVVGLSFAMRQVAQLLLMCDRQDIGIAIGSKTGGEPTGEEGALRRRGEPLALPGEPRIFVYDNYPSGIGFSAPLFQMRDELLKRTGELISSCECEHGCPACVGPLGDTGPMAKTVALRMLELLGAGVRDSGSGSFSDKRPARLGDPELWA
jgi:DEAD/DEAH box helicase domain-containing protein